MPDSHELTGETAATNASRKEARRSIIKKITSRDVPTYIEQVQAPDGSLALIVVERLARDPAMTDAEAAACVRDARAASTLQHANVVRGRAITIRREDIVVACDYVDGERWSDLASAAGATGGIPEDVLARIVLDVLSGLGALHEVKSSTGQPLRLAHGAITFDNVLIGSDGLARLLHTSRIRRPGSAATTDPRSDLIAVASLLRDAAGASSKSALAELSRRVASSSEAARPATAAALAAEIKKAAGMRLATTSQVATFVQAKAGTKIGARRKLAEQHRSASAMATAKPAEAKPAETKPVEAKPAEAKPIEPAPKPVEAKPIDPAPKPVEAKPQPAPIAKLAEAKPPVTSKPLAPKPTAPAAKPLATKPVAAKPLETKPATPAAKPPAKPAETKPVAPKPAVTKPAPTKVEAPRAPAAPKLAPKPATATTTAPKTPGAAAIKTEALVQPLARPVETAVDPSTLPPKNIDRPSDVPTIKPVPKVEPPPFDIDLDVELDGTETLPRIEAAAPVPLTPPVTERPLPDEPKVVLTKQTPGIGSPLFPLFADEDDIESIDSMPPSGGHRPTPSWVPPPPPAPTRDPMFESAYAHRDTPAAAPVMAPSAGRVELTSERSTSSSPVAAESARARTKRTRAIAGVVIAVCAIVISVAIWRLSQTSSDEPSTAAAPNSPRLGTPAPRPTPATPRETTPPKAEPTGEPQAAPVPTWTPRAMPAAPEPPAEPEPAPAPLPRNPRNATEPAAPSSPRPRFDPTRI